MKKILKLIPILFLVLTFSCEQDDDNSRFYNDPTSGWVEFATPSSGTTVSPFAESLSLPVSLRVPVYEGGLNVTYSLVAVEGDFTSIVGTLSTDTLSFSSDVSPGADGTPSVQNIVIGFENLDLVTEPIVFDVVLTAVDVDGVTIGVDDDSITSYRVSTPCPVVTADSYNVDVTGPNGATPSHTVALTPTGVANQFSVTSTWGPEFVAEVAGQPALAGQYLYSATISINDDLTVSVVSTDSTVGGDGSAETDGYGTYDSCNDVFLITLTQGLFTTDFTVDLTMTAL
ncbi:hypothetical protein [Winogradskyella ludwigii]|jgi:hypothetical protein|uniref:hypothetical protein n=1 Tax=Winogradskyella ludwigii TaxID=2686076 RepID=UPI0015CBEADC|nr:hypothetical protein [Winogradskyella ludwigii]